MSRLLLDTHIVLWLDSGDPALRPATRQAIDTCWRDGGTLLMSAVSVWEIAQLADRGHITLNGSPAQWVERFAAAPGVEVVDLSWRAAAAAYRLDGFEHRDPGDRLLAATAIDLGVPLVTYDHRLHHFARGPGAAQGFTVLPDPH